MLSRAFLMLALATLLGTVGCHPPQEGGENRFVVRSIDHRYQLITDRKTGREYLANGNNGGIVEVTPND